MLEFGDAFSRFEKENEGHNRHRDRSDEHRNHEQDQKQADEIHPARNNITSGPRIYTNLARFVGFTVECERCHAKRLQTQ